MINLAVIEIKDIAKYLVRIMIVVTIIYALTRYFFSGKNNMQNVTMKLGSKSFTICFDTTVPAIKQVNNKDEDNNKQEPLKKALQVELGMMNSLKNKNEVEKKEQETKTDEKKELAQTGLETKVVESNVPQNFTTTYNTVKIKNNTDIKLTKEMMKPDVKINTKTILIYHTHSCESYTPTEKYSYKKTGNFRTTDKDRSVIRVGTELEAYMKQYGYKVIHDTSLYDYPAYNGSYSRSYTGVSKLLDKNKGTEVLFDLHRDAIADSSYAPTVKIGDEYAAQIMFVIGSNGSGAQHDNWTKNLKFAIKIQEKANELYPGLFKPIVLRNSRYNQHLANGASIIEVGATGNTLEQCLTSMKFFSKVLSEI